MYMWGKKGWRSEMWEGGGEEKSDRINPIRLKIALKSISASQTGCIDR